jgi:hypothetical protein
LLGAECYQAEKRVVIGAVDPRVVGQRRTHAAPAASAMAAIATRRRGICGGPPQQWQRYSRCRDFSALPSGVLATSSKDGVAGPSMGAASGRSTRSARSAKGGTHHRFCSFAPPSPEDRQA